MFEIQEATIAQVHKAMTEGRLTCRQLVEGYLKRIEAYDQKGPSLNAVICINPELFGEADALDRSFKKDGLVGPLHGIPILLKDNVNTADMPTTGGSVSLKGFYPDRDAFIVSRMKAAGAIVLAKVNLHEFAIWGETVSSILGQTVNPYDSSRTPGGSSGGTGAGIAANFGMVGIGTDTVNSIRSPGASNNLVGLRPTVGLVSRSGIIPYSLTQDTAGPIARTVEDAVRVLDVIAGYDVLDTETSWGIGRKPSTYLDFLDESGLNGKRIGVLESFFGREDIHKEVNAAVRAAIDAMESNGAVIVSIEDAIDSDALVSEISVHLHDLKGDLGEYLANLPTHAPVHSIEEILTTGKHHPKIGEHLSKAIALGAHALEYKERLFRRSKLQTQLMKIMADLELDAIVYPHQKQLVCRIGESQQERNGALGSVTGFPAIAIPAGFSSPSPTAPIGVPIGIEILGRPFSEPTLIEIAYGYERVMNHRRSPWSTPPLIEDVE